MSGSASRPASRFDFTAGVPPWSGLGRVHCIAIGGAGVSAVARLLLQRGLVVTGSDSADTPVLAALRAAGATVDVGHDPGHLDGADTVVISSAVRETNVELVAARERGLRVLHRSQALASAVSDRTRVAVAGANGKTTTSSMLTVALRSAGLDPAFAIGGEIAALDTNAHLGRGSVAVVEADESDGSFVLYRPRVGLVTSVQPDHLDFFRTFDAVRSAYRDFVLTIDPEGLLVVCTDDPGARELGDWARSHGRRVLGYGEAADAQVRVEGYRPDGMGSRADLRRGDASYPLVVHVPGRYNVLNAAAAFAAATEGLGVDPDAVVAGLSTFSGTRRRFEPKGSAGGVDVVDDYAHNPGKVAAVTGAARAIADATGRRLVLVFQPHLYSRTRDFAAELGRALSVADVLVVMDVYAAREDPMPGVSGALVAEAARAARPGAEVSYEPDTGAVASALAALVRPGDLCLTVGAGDVTGVGPALLDLLGARS